MDNISIGNHQDPMTFDAKETDLIKLPSNDFISDSEISRAGQDLVLTNPEGQQIIVEDYFVAAETPIIQSPNGSILSENLVHSFLKISDEYAQLDVISDVSPIGAIEEIEGSVTIIRANGMQETGTLGTPVYEGDVIETSADSAANIVFLDDTSMAVSANARMSIDNYSFDPATESGETNLSVLRGVFVYTSGLIGRDDPDDVLIETPVGSIGIRGTIIAGNINPNGQSEITVIEGAIVIKNATGEVTLSEQFESVRLSGFQSAIEATGIKTVDNMGKTYGSVQDVVPGLFSSINDTVKQETNSEIQNNRAENAEEVITETEDKAAPDTTEPQIEVQEEKPLLNLDVKPDGQRTDPKGNLRFDRLNDLKDTLENKTLNNNENNNRPFKFQERLIDTNDDDNDDNTNYISSITAGVNRTSAPVNTAILNQDPAFDFDNDGNIDNFIVDPSYETYEIKSGTTTLYSPLNAPASETGKDYAFLGDFNGDGKSDYVVGAPGADSAIVVTKNGGSIVQTTYTHASDFLRVGNYVSNAGDFNGDGKSDILIGTELANSNGDYEAYLVYGTNPSSNSTVNLAGISSSQAVKIISEHKILTGAGVGDINGDGFDDFALALQDGSTVNTYVVYGKNGVTNIDDNYLNDPKKALKITHEGVLNPSQYQIHAIGDKDGDGFDDLQVGVSGGVQLAIHGGIGGNAPYALDNSPTDENAAIGTISPANSSAKALVGNVNFVDNGETDLSMSGGSGNNHFGLSNNSFKNIDGGLGLDTIRYGLSARILDFTNINFEQISQIERIHFSQDNATIKLTAENIFNLLKSSDNGNFTIELGGTGGVPATIGTLQIDDLDNNATGSLSDKVLIALNDHVDGATYQGISNGNHHFQIGDYNLYIDTDLTTQVV